MSRASKESPIDAPATEHVAYAESARRGAPARRLAGARLRRNVALAGAVLAAIALSACGRADMRETTGTYAGEDGAAAPYLNVGNLVYQVQISRSLNPWENEDSAFLKGLPDDGKQLESGEEWFGVFLQVFNETKTAQPDASDVTVYDTEGQTYHPIMPSDSNIFAYRPGMIWRKSQVPKPDSPASYDASGGALLIYKIKLEALEDRPLRIKIANPEDPSETATAELDV
jgi:hypothetical protein